MTHFEHLELFRRPEKWRKIKEDLDRGYPDRKQLIKVMEEMLPQAEQFLKELKSGK